MKSKEFIAKAIDIAKNYKTLYVMGCFGAPLTAKNKARYTQNHDYNKQAARTKMINAASEDTFGFDCVCLIKGILWGWNGDKSKSYGGAGYAVNNVPDIGADSMITKCSGVSTTGWDKMTPGEALWCSGHIGIYIGDGLGVECTPAWKNKVQITAVGNIGAKSGYPTRKWTKHGKLPYIDYSDQTATAPAPAAKEVKAKGAAKSFNKALAREYTCKGNLNMRDGAGKDNRVLVVLPKGQKVRNYGYYTNVNGVNWLYVQTTLNGVQYTGHCSAEWLV